MRHIVYARADGGLSVVVPNINTDPEPEDISVEDAEKRAWNSLPSDAVNPVFIDPAVLPSDRTFRNAWVPCSINGCKVDMDKAREIWKDKMRAAREPKFKTLDIQYMRADEAGDTKTKTVISAEKQALRDVTNDPRLVAAATTDELKSVWPDCLT